MNDLNKIVEKFYTVFAEYSVSYPLKDVCTACCLKEPFHTDLAYKKLKYISYEAIYEYNESAFANELHIEEAKYFLPKQVELLVLGTPPKNQDELLFYRFKGLSLTLENWTQEEIDVITDFSKTYFKTIVNEKYFHRGLAIQDCLILLDDIGANLNNLFQLWEEQTSKESTFLFGYFVDYLGDLAEIRKRNFDPFISKELVNSLADWLMEDTVKEHFLIKLEELVGEKYNPDYHPLYTTIEKLKTLK